MKKILKLLARLETAENGLYSVRIFSDSSGWIHLPEDGEQEGFETIEECIKVLKKLLKNAK